MPRGRAQPEGRAGPRTCSASATCSSASPASSPGGERQRVALARAIVREPVGLPARRAALEPRRQAARLGARGARAVPAARAHDHDLRHARPGRGDGDGRPRRRDEQGHRSARSAPRPRSTTIRPTRFVATFLGSPPMNLVEIGEAIVGFRPEHLRSGRVPRGRARASRSPSAVESQEYLGSERILYGRLEGGRFSGTPVVSRLPASYARDARPTARRARSAWTRPT